MTESGKERFQDIDVLKGMAIFLVVLGHLQEKAPPVNDWYNTLKWGFIYRFHMPVFFYLAGFVSWYRWPRMDSVATYRAYAGKLLTRLGPWYLLLAVGIILGKWFLMPFMHIDNAPHRILTELSCVVLWPQDSCARQLWFIYVYLVLSLVRPILTFITRQRFWPLMIMAALLYMVPMPRLFALDMAGEYLLFFVMGGIAVAYREKYLSLLDRYCDCWVVIFLSSFVLTYSSLSDKTLRLFLGLLAVPALHGLVRRPWFAGNELLETIGKYTWTIYLFHMIAIGLMKGLLGRPLGPEHRAFVYAVPLLVTGGIVGPILLKKLFQWVYLVGHPLRDGAKEIRLS